MEKSYYKKYYHLERGHWWFKARGEILMNHLDTVFQGRTDLKILNVGVATGHTSELLSRFGKVTSVEYDIDCFNFVRENVKIDIVNASILDLPFDENQFDLVCAFDVIEHVENDTKAVAEMRRVCKKGGVLSVTVPAFMFLWSEHDVVNHHFRRYTAKILRGLFEQKDEPVFHSYFNFWLFFPIAFFRLLMNFIKGNKKIAPEEAQSDFESFNNGIVNSIFYRIFKSENLFLKNKVHFPVGVSLLSTWRKK
jgi:SAM-dependent methyltransferase